MTMVCLQPFRAFFVMFAICVFGTCCALRAQTHGQTNTVSGPALSVAISAPDYDPVKLKTDEGLLQSGKPLSWAAGSPLFDLGAKAYLKQGSGVATCTNASYAADKDRAVILHLVHWSVPATANALPQLQSSVWYVYRHPRNGKASVLVPASTTGTGDPLLYGAKHLLILNIDIPSAAIVPTALQSTMTAPVTQGTPDIATDISALFTALTGISGGTAAMAIQTVTPVVSAFVAVTCEDGTPKLPFSVEIADAAAQPSAAPADGGGAVHPPLWPPPRRLPLAAARNPAALRLAQYQPPPAAPSVVPAPATPCPAPWAARSPAKSMVCRHQRRRSGSRCARHVLHL